MYPNAASRKVKIYSRTEVSKAQGLEKIRRNFWNNKAEELCQDKVLSKWKATAINGVIDTAWTLTKTAVLVTEANNLRDEELQAEPVSTPKPRKRQKVATVDENVKRTLNTHRQLLKINQTLRSLKDIANTTTKKKAKIMQAEDEPHEAKKKSLYLDGNRTHNLQIRSTVTLPTELQGRTEKVGDDFRW